MRDDIESWLKELTSKNITDWLIVVVETYDAKRTNKLLPRTTVLDKIRADFAPKQGNIKPELFEFITYLLIAVCSTNLEVKLRLK